MSRHPAVLIFASAILGVIAACNAISGVESITFDRTPDAGAPDAGGGGGRGAPDAAGGGGAPDAGACSEGPLHSPVQLAGGQDGGGGPWNVTVDLDRNLVYWTNSTTAGSAILSVPVDGGSTMPTEDVTLASSQDQAGIGWNDAGGIYYAPEGAVTSDPSGWYLTSKALHTVTKLPFQDAGIQLAGQQTVPAGIAVFDGNVYWADYYDGGVLMTAPADGSGTASPLPSAGDGLSPWNIALDATTNEPVLYWTAHDTGNLPESVIMKMGIHDSAPTRFATQQYKPWGIVVDECYVYWTNDDAVAGAVMRGRKSDGSTIQIAGNQVHPRGLAMDAQNIYWVTSGDATTPGTVMQWAK